VGSGGTEKTILAQDCTRRSEPVGLGSLLPIAALRTNVRCYEEHRPAGQAVRATQTVLDLDAILIDGWLPRNLRAALTDGVRAELEKIDVTGMAVPAITAGTIGADARPLGAASLPLTARFLVELPDYPTSLISNDPTRTSEHQPC
jgi:hypothetical protein